MLQAVLFLAYLNLLYPQATTVIRFTDGRIDLESIPQPILTTHPKADIIRAVAQ